MGIMGFSEQGKKFIHIIQLTMLLLLGCILLDISQKNSIYFDCNVKQQKCVIGEFKNNAENIQKEIDYNQIEGYYLYSSPKGYFSVYDSLPNTIFVLKIKQNNVNENVMLPIFGRVDLLRADNIYNDILKQGIYIEQENNYNILCLILSCLSFLLFFLKIYSLIANKKKEN